MVITSESSEVFRFSPYLICVGERLTNSSSGRVNIAELCLVHARPAMTRYTTNCGAMHYNIYDRFRVPYVPLDQILTIIVDHIDRKNMTVWLLSARDTRYGIPVRVESSMDSTMIAAAPV